ncbi:uncharacterized protein LOC126481629 [Schistocerca serialis cubense]|uniref:uncharacterized protein LOC126481629 n=1 Tax=Schistocerca serialis cubense TaxID=2023355 RepID=UPI00214F09E6|nr:uncharacterized protein LOC126481629 [Schistocerca serialis cubense]
MGPPTAPVFAVLVALVLASAAPPSSTSRTTVGTTERPWNRGKAFMNQLAQLLDARVKDYGIFRMPLHDYTQELNRTVYGIKLEGKMMFRYGFIMSLDRIAFEPREYQLNEMHGITYIRGTFKLQNLTIFYDLSARLKDQGPIIGTAKHVFETCGIEVRVWKPPSERPHYALNVKHVQSARYTEYLPDTPVTRAMARVSRLTSSTYLWNDIENWNDGVFNVLLGEILHHITYPF